MTKIINKHTYIINCITKIIIPVLEIKHFHVILENNTFSLYNNQFNKK